MDANLRQQTRSISPKFWHDQRGSLSFKPPEPAGKDMDFSCDKHYTAGKWEKKRNTGLCARTHMRVHAGETASHVLHIRPQVL